VSPCAADAARPSWTTRLNVGASEIIHLQHSRFTAFMTDTITAEPLRAVSLSPSITVRDVRASLAWYRDVLGFEVEREMERDGKLRGVALHAGDVRLLLNQDDGAKGFDRVKGAGLSLMFSTRQSVDAVAAHITAHGGTLASEPADMPWGQRMFRVLDPDGFIFVVSAPLASPT
jgi:uncharacterized glyoxalase superfamily protein PhnB